MSTQILSTAIVFAAVVVFLVTAVRALPLPDAWKRRKPLSCNFCMMFWASIPALTPLLFTPEMRTLGVVMTMIVCFATQGLALIGIALTGWAPPELPPLTMDEMVRSEPPESYRNDTGDAPCPNPKCDLLDGHEEPCPFKVG